jgi:hypothetical protein
LDVAGTDCDETLETVVVGIVVVRMAGIRVLEGTDPSVVDALDSEDSKAVDCMDSMTVAMRGVVVVATGTAVVVVVVGHRGQNKSIGRAAAGSGQVVFALSAR